MANDADQVRKDLIARGYQIERPIGRGKSSYTVHDPASGILVARFPVSPSRGSWLRNLRAAIARYERTGEPARSSKVPAREIRRPHR